MKNLFNDLPRSVHEPARRAQANQDCVRVLPLRLGDSRGNNFNRYGMDDSVDIHLHDARLKRRGAAQSGNCGELQQGRQSDTSLSGNGHTS